MNRKSLQAVLRTVVGPGDPVPDDELLRRYAADRDDEAFAELVRRHGRLVWAVCRQLTRSDADADDAFQATFLVLVRRAGAVRDASKLSAWLHGVAYKVCANARRAAATRAAREQAAAAEERHGRDVPDSAWDRALAAVHEEVNRLPETLRVPFVLCCLEGKGATDAAAQLGWKLGTFSGRLTRAKDAVVERLTARGLALAVAVAVTAVADAPAAATQRAIALANGGAVPSSILQLSKGVIGMSVLRTKWLAAGLVLACGLCAGSGNTGWMSSADAQSRPLPPLPGDTPPPPPLQDEKARAAAEERLKKAQAERDRAMAEVERARELLKEAAKATQPPPPPAPAGRAVERRETTTKAPAAASDYDYVLASEMGRDKFTAFLREREARGWEFKGEATLTHDGKAAAHWVFKKAATQTRVMVADTARGTALRAAEGWMSRPFPTPKAEAAKQEEARALEAELKALQEKLARLKSVTPPAVPTPPAAPAATTVSIALKHQSAALIAEKLQGLLTLAPKGEGGPLTVAADARSNTLVLRGSPEAVKWAADVIKSLDAAKPVTTEKK